MDVGKKSRWVMLDKRKWEMQVVMPGDTLSDEEKAGRRKVEELVRTSYQAWLLGRKTMRVAIPAEEGLSMICDFGSSDQVKESGIIKWGADMYV